MHRIVGSLVLVALVASATPAQIVHVDQPSGTKELLIAVSPVNDRVVWVSGQHGTWLRTTDGGAHWQVGHVPGADTLQFRDVHAVDANTAYLLSIGNGRSPGSTRPRMPASTGRCSSRTAIPPVSTTASISGTRGTA